MARFRRKRTILLLGKLSYDGRREVEAEQHFAFQKSDQSQEDVATSWISTGSSSLILTTSVGNLQVHWLALDLSSRGDDGSYQHTL